MEMQQVHLTKPSKMKEQSDTKIFLYVFLTIFIVYGLTLMLPVVWLLINALKTSREYLLNSSFSLPEGKLQWINFWNVFQFRMDVVVKYICQHRLQYLDGICNGALPFSRENVFVFPCDYRTGCANHRYGRGGV